jgi:hypothetical protein
MRGTTFRSLEGIEPDCRTRPHKNHRPFPADEQLHYLSDRTGRNTDIHDHYRVSLAAHGLLDKSVQSA